MSVMCGTTGDVPVAGDFDKDGKTDVAVYRPSTGGYYYKTSSSGFVTQLSRDWGLYYGQTGDEPMMGDFDGDGSVDACWRRNPTSTIEW